MIFAMATSLASLEVIGAATDASPSFMVGGSDSSSSIKEPNIVSDIEAANSSGDFFCFARPRGVAFSGTATLVLALVEELSDLIVLRVIPFTVVLPSFLFAIASTDRYRFVW